MNLLEHHLYVSKDEPFSLYEYESPTVKIQFNELDDSNLDKVLLKGSMNGNPVIAVASPLVGPWNSRMHLFIFVDKFMA